MIVDGDIIESLFRARVICTFSKWYVLVIDCKMLMHYFRVIESGAYRRFYCAYIKSMPTLFELLRGFHVMFRLKRFEIALQCCSDE